MMNDISYKEEQNNYVCLSKAALFGFFLLIISPLGFAFTLIFSSGVLKNVKLIKMSKFFLYIYIIFLILVLISLFMYLGAYLFNDPNQRPKSIYNSITGKFTEKKPVNYYLTDDGELIEK